MPDGFIQRHFANLRHIRNIFRIDPRAARGTGQIAPWLSGVVQLVHPAFPGAFLFSDPEVRSFANPAAGANFQIIIPPNEAWGIRCVHFTIATDATVASREPDLSFDDSVSEFYHATAAATVVASLARTFSWGRNTGYTRAHGLDITQGLPDFVMDEGWRINSAIRLLQAGDQVSDVTVLVDVFPR